MSMSKIGAIAGTAVVLAATAAFAMTKMSDGEGIYVSPRGYHVVKSTKQGHARIMKEARALQAGAVVYRSGGKLYLLEDHKMPSGNMMFEENWFKQALGDPSGY
jgi:hypothetical protein